MLIPRVGRFNLAHPNVVINLSTCDLPFDQAREDFDASFHYGANDWPGVVYHHPDRLIRIRPGKGVPLPDTAIVLTTTRTR